MFVIDAGAVVDIVARLPRGERVLSRMADEDLLAPDILHLEVLSALARLERAGQLDGPSVEAAAADTRDLPVSLLPSRALLDDALSLRHSLRVSDAFYVAAALQMGVPLLTTDARLTRGAPGGVSILLVS